jgi:hypothetical protein
MKLDANKILSSFRLSTRFMYNFKTFDGPFASTFETVIFWLLWVLTFFIRRHKSLLVLYMVLLPILQSCQYIWNCNILTFMSMPCEHGVDIPMKNNLFCWGEHDEIKALHFFPNHTFAASRQPTLFLFLYSSLWCVHMWPLMLSWALEHKTQQS